jgi:hypothetical protein
MKVTWVDLHPLPSWTARAAACANSIASVRHSQCRRAALFRRAYDSIQLTIDPGRVGSLDVNSFTVAETRRAATELPFGIQPDVDVASDRAAPINPQSMGQGVNLLVRRRTRGRCGERRAGNWLRFHLRKCSTLSRLRHGAKSGRPDRRRPGVRSHFAYSRIRRRSATNCLNAASASCPSGKRRSDDGWTVISAGTPNSVSLFEPRSLITRTSLPVTDRAAVAPRHTIKLGLIAFNSASSHGRQAAISRAFGFWWSLRFPRGSHLKCFTAFVR